MSKEDKPPPSPNHGLFDPSHLLGAPSLGLVAGMPFPHLTHLPAYPWLGRPAFPPALFSSLGALPSPLLAHGLPHASAAAEFAALFNMSKHLSEMPSTATSTPSPSKRSRTPTPAPAHQKTSKSSTSTSSSSSSKDLHHTYLPFSMDGKDAWPLNGSAFNLKSLTSHSGSSSSRKRRHREGKSSSHEGAKVRRSAAHSSGVHSAGGREEVEDGGVLNLSKSAPSATVTSTPPPVTPGVEDLSMKKPDTQKPDKESKTTNGATMSDTDTPDVSSPGSDVTNDSDDGNVSDCEKGREKLPAHQIDGDRKQLLAEQIRQQLLAGTLSPSPSHQATPLVIPSLRLRHGKEKGDKKSAPYSQFPLLNFAHDYTRPESLLLERDLLGLPSTSTALHATSSHAAAFSFLPAELRLNHQSKEESQDSLVSMHMSEAAEDKLTSGSERLMDSESHSGWGSDDDATRNRASSSASPGPSYGDDPSKRRNVVLNEKELLIPLEHGWRRQTTIHGMGRRGIVGEVLYFAPCNKKMKTIPDVMRYLDRHAITDLSRENFTFNTKVNVGQFYEIRDKQVVPLTDAEILERIAMSKGKRARMQMLARKKNEKHLRQQALAKQMMEAKYRKRQEQQDMARKAAELKFQMRLEKEQQKEMAKKVKEVRLMERQREKERSRALKQQEKIRQQEQLRIEREMRAQQILEARRRRQVELEEMRLKEIARKNQSNLLWLQMEREREMKKQQQIVEKEQEKERRRQHLLLVKALEQRKKQEEKQEKERQREEKIREKNLEREKKLAQRQLEMLIAREMKKPMDDMELRDGKPLPKFPRCPEAKLSGPAFSDCLMVVEFVHNFADTLGLDSESLPSLEVLQNGLLNTNDEDVEEVVTLYLHLLRFALDDLGVPNPRSALTALNQKITDLEITDATMSEVTRLFLYAHGEKRMSQWLEEIPLEALNATKKAAIIAFLCNELLSSKRLSGEIERTLEAINTLRRDKWIVEGKLRKLRTVRARKYLKLELASQPPQSVLDEDSMTNTTNTSSKAVSDEEEEKEEEEEDKEEEEEMESCDDNSTTGNRSEDEDEGLSKEEMEKKIDKLVKQHNSFDTKVADVSKQLRGTCLGQDRYKRFYWILPASGGVFVEGIESGETEALPFEAELLAKQKAKREERRKVEEIEKGEQGEVVSVKEETASSEESKAVSQGAENSMREEEKSVKTEATLDQSVMDQSVAFENKHSEEKVNAESSESEVVGSESQGKGEVLVNGKQASESASNGCDSIQEQNDKAVNADTQNCNSAAASTSPSLPAAAQIGDKTDCPLPAPQLAKSGPTSAAVSPYQEPILSKLNDLLKWPHLSAAWQRSEPSVKEDACAVRTDNCGDKSSIAPAVITVSSSASSTLSSSLSLTSSSVSTPSAVALTMPSLSTVSCVMSTTAVSSTAPYSLSLASLSSSSASSTLSSLAAAAATVSSAPNSSASGSGAPMTSRVTPRVTATLSSISTPTSTILSSTPLTSGLSVTMASPASVVNSVSPVTPASAVSPLKSPASKSLLTVSLLSPEFSTSALASKSGALSPNTSASSTTKPCALSPTIRKTMSSTATTILSSTPLSMLAAMSKVTTLSPSSNAASTSVVSVENGPELRLSSTPISHSASLSLLSSPHTVSLLNSTPVTSPIPSVSSPMKDKKANFVSIDALLKKDPESGAALSPVATQTSTSTPTPTPTPTSSSNNHFLPPNLFPPSPLISEHFLKSYVDILDQKPWFSILPRIPCDEVGLTLSKVVTSSAVPQLGMVSSDNIASASLSLLSLLPMQQQQQQQAAQQQKAASSSQSQPSPAHSHAFAHLQTESQTKSMLDFSSTFQAHLSQSSLTDISMAVSTATSTSDMSSLCGDSFKVPAPPSDFMISESLLDFDPTAELMKIQGERLPIPINKQRGWWKIQDAEQVRQLYNSLLSRGVRERNMAYMLRKYMDFICTQLCVVDTGKAIKQEREDKPAMAPVSEEEKKGGDKQTSDGSEVAKSSQTEDGTIMVKQEIKRELDDTSEDKDQEDKDKMQLEEDDEEDDAIPVEPEDSWNMQVEFEVELACLEDVEALEDRIFNASLQVKQVWKLPQRASEDPEIHMVDRSVADPQPPCFYPVELARQRLQLLESNIERRYLKPPLIRNVQLNLSTLGTERAPDAKATEGDGEGGRASEEHTMEYPEDVPPGLMLWRRAVHNAQSPAQLNLCTQLLGNSIAWEKSIMKVTCQICLKDDNEAELLLCDGCDKGYHTYCFKPKMENIPDGDWYCYECVSKVSGKSHCIVCGVQGGKMVECERCPRAIHTDCLDPPLPRMPKKWQCASCIQTKNKKNSKRKRKEAPPSHQATLGSSAGREKKDGSTGTTKDRKVSESNTSTVAAPPEKKKKESAKEKKERPAKEEKKKDEKKKEEKKKEEKPKEKKEEKEKKEKKEKKPRERKSKKQKEEEAALLDPSKEADMVACGRLLLELEKGEYGWPFTRPVSSKQFPSYRKYIKQPMDFTTMKHKLKDNIYKSRSEVANDMKLIWINCETFNEDDSEVGQAGHNLHRVFTHKWKELFPDDVL